jgi:RND family efflux transporter MFP subunit
MKLIVRIFALVLLVAAVAAVFFYEPKPETDDTPPPVRPVKSMIVGPAPRVPSVHFPGVVDARAGVDLSFEVGGRIVEFPATRGLEVKEGDVLARLDDRDYANDVKTAEAELAYYESNFNRMEAALAKNAVSQDEYSSARASRDKARASLDTAKKALDDTVLRARFTGVVSDTYADNFDTVSAGTAVLKLQDLTAFDLAVSVPESYVLSLPSEVRREFLFEASFDSLPGRTFPVTIKDAARVADSVTQTYRATFTLEAPADLVILPGMTCTVTSTIPEDEMDDAGAIQLAVPSNAVGSAADTTSFVWRLEDNGDGTFTARRATITLGQRTGDNIFVLSGLSAGDRIAVAGVTILTEGRVVRLYEEQPAPAAEEAAPAAEEEAPAP